MPIISTVRIEPNLILLLGDLILLLGGGGGGGIPDFCFVRLLKLPSDNCYCT